MDGSTLPMAPCMLHGACGVLLSDPNCGYLEPSTRLEGNFEGARALPLGRLLRSGAAPARSGGRPWLALGSRHWHCCEAGKPQGSLRQTSSL
eukprot:366119-Chlamydomonas_euryale.AAC.2